jgi:hypothetical protein
MKSPVAHWGAREWRRNMDDLVPDPARPQAFPSTYPMDLMGRIRVKLAAEDGNLVAYGFGRQRVVLPAKSVGKMHTVRSFRTGQRITHGRALLVLDHQDQILLRADGQWETYGAVEQVCIAAGVHRPTYLSRSAPGSYKSPGRRVVRQPPRFKKAPGYVKLRTYPRGRPLRLLVVALWLGLLMGWGGYLGALPAVALPEWFGAVRTLIGIVGSLLGVAAGLWIAAAVTHGFTNALRWLGASWAAGSPAPPRRFFERRSEHAGAWRATGNLALVFLVIALIGWGPGVGISSLADGFRDAALVSQLRQNGSTTSGKLIDVPSYSTDDNGNTTETDVPTLSFNGQQWPDPSIGGRPLALDAADPIDTDIPETIVYDPLEPWVVAAKQQIAGSVWHGAPTANLISGGLFTLALPPMAWFLVLRVRRRRSRRAKQFVDDLTTS